MSAIPTTNTRVDKAGQELMTAGSVALLMKLACGEGAWTSWKILGPFVAALKISDLDALPLEARGWVEMKKGRTGALLICITDAGNATVRSLVSWLALQQKEVAR